MSFMAVKALVEKSTLSVAVIEFITDVPAQRTKFLPLLYTHECINTERKSHIDRREGFRGCE